MANRPDVDEAYARAYEAMQALRIAEHNYDQAVLAVENDAGRAALADKEEQR